MRAIRLFVVVALGVSALVAGDGAVSDAAGSSTVGVVGPLVNVRPTDGVDVRWTSSAALRSGRNETQSFQILIHVDSAVTVTDIETADLFGPGSNRLAASNVSVFREGYYRVTVPSDGELWSSSPCPTACDVPDALIPKRDPYYNQVRNAFGPNGIGFPVAAGTTQAFWIDVFVPAGQTVGRYEGSLTVKKSDGNVAVAVVVDVIDFTLPSTSTLRGSFQTGYQQICSAHALNPCNYGNENVWKLYALYARAALDHRITVSNPGFGGPQNDLAKFRTYATPLLNGTASTRLVGAQMTDVTLVRYEAGAMSAWKREAAEAGFLSKLSFFCDETGQNYKLWVHLCNGPVAIADARVAAGSDRVTSNAALFDATWTGMGVSGALVPSGTVIRQVIDAHTIVLSGAVSGTSNATTLTFESPNTESYATAAANWNNTPVAPDPGPLPVVKTGTTEDFAWALGRSPGLPVASAVTTRLPPVSLLHPKNQASRRSTYDAFLAADARNRLWIYTSCLSSGCAPVDCPPGPTCVPPLWDGQSLWSGWPSYHIDQAPLEQRAMPWQAFLYRASGEYYFETTKKLDAAWSPCNVQASNCLFNEGGNGDGTLFYPGTTNAVGGTTPIPIETIRLKRIRDGRQDFEYLHHLSTHGKDAEARAVAGELFPSMYQSDGGTDQYGAQQALDDARSRLARLVTSGTTVPPGRVTSLTAQAGASKVGLTWSTPGSGGAPITGYDVRFATNANMNAATVVIDATAGNPAPTTFERTGLSPGVAHFFQVRATNIAGPGVWGPVVPATATPYATPGAPTGANAARRASQTVRVSFSVAPDGGSVITDYDVEYSTDASFGPGAGTFFEGGTTTAAFLDVTGLTNGTTYFFRVRATNAAGVGPWSSASNGAKPFTVPGAPTNVTATRASTRSGRVSFAVAPNGGSAITDYDVEYSTNASFGPGAGTFFEGGTTTGTNLTVTGLVSGRTYYFRVRATNAAGNGVWSGRSNGVRP